MGCGSLRGKWKLRMRSVLACAAWVIVNVLISTAVVIHKWWKVKHFPEADDPEVTMALIGAVLHLIGIYCAGIVVGGYICVACRTRRPAQLHAHGLVLLLMLQELVGRVVSNTGYDFDLPMLDMVGSALTVTMFGMRRTIFVILIIRKFSSLGPQTNRCLGIRLWGKLLAASTFAMAFLAAIPGVLWKLCMAGRGLPDANVFSPTYLGPRVETVELVDQVVLGFTFVIGVLGTIGVVISSFAVMLVARRMVGNIINDMVDRQVVGKQLANVRSMLRHHLAGLLASLLTTQLVLLCAIMDGANSLDRRIPRGEAIEDLLVACAQLFDTVGDLVGILLLSGIGVLLLREDPDAGNIRGQIRSLLYSAVLTSRADCVFEGHVASTTSECCIASFPGAYLADWNSLTWMCRQGEMSSACVFLPKSDPQQRFGKHVLCPDTPGNCWCHSLYGAEQPWGCMWFHVWKENLEKAVELGIQLVVVFFPGEAGQGKVAWDALGTPDASDGLGLGRSQKAEVAYLAKAGYKFMEEDIDEFRARLKRGSVRSL